MARPAATVAARIPRPGPAQRWSLRRVRRQPGPARLHRRGIYILPTRAGAVYALLVLVMLLGAMNYSNSLAFALTFLLVGLGLVTMHHTHRNLLRLQVAAVDATPAFAGDMARFRVRVDNPSDVQRFGLMLAAHDGAARALADLAPRASAEVALPVATAARGRLAAPAFTVSTTFPLNLFRSWSWVWLDMSCLVYPQPEAGPVSPRPPAFAAGGRTRAAGTGDDDFTGLRDYRRGDPARRIHWKRTSIRALPVVKEFDQNRRPQHRFDWDSLAALPVEARLSRLCRWVLEADRRGERYALHLPACRLGPDAGPAHRERCLEALALFPEKPAS